MILTALNRQDMHFSIIILSGWKYLTTLRDIHVIRQEMKAGTRLKFVNHPILNDRYWHIADILGKSRLCPL